MGDDAQLNEQEVQHGTFGGDSSVDLSERVDLDLSLSGVLLLLLDIHRSLLGDLERLNQCGVLENGGWISLRQVVKEGGFQTSKGDLEFILLADKLFLSLLKIGFLDFDNHGKKLIFKTTLGDNEVDNGALGSSFGLVMWVDKLGLEVEFELWAHLDIL